MLYHVVGYSLTRSVAPKTDCLMNERGVVRFFMILRRMLGYIKSQINNNSSRNVCR